VGWGWYEKARVLDGKVSYLGVFLVIARGRGRRERESKLF
jgi:hypothetical protein